MPTNYAKIYKKQKEQSKPDLIIALESSLSPLQKKKLKLTENKKLMELAERQQKIKLANSINHSLLNQTKVPQRYIDEAISRTPVNNARSFSNDGIETAKLINTKKMLLTNEKETLELSGIQSKPVQIQLPTEELSSHVYVGEYCQTEESIFTKKQQYSNAQFNDEKQNNGQINQNQQLTNIAAQQYSICSQENKHLSSNISSTNANKFSQNVHYFKTESGESQISNQEQLNQQISEAISPDLTENKQIDQIINNSTNQLKIQQTNNEQQPSQKLLIMQSNSSQNQQQQVSPFKQQLLSLQNDLKISEQFAQGIRQINPVSTTIHYQQQHKKNIETDDAERIHTYLHADCDQNILFQTNIADVQQSILNIKNSVHLKGQELLQSSIAEIEKNQQEQKIKQQRISLENEQKYKDNSDQSNDSSRLTQSSQQLEENSIQQQLSPDFIHNLVVQSLSLQNDNSKVLTDQKSLQESQHLYDTYKQHLQSSPLLDNSLIQQSGINQLSKMFKSIACPPQKQNTQKSIAQQNTFTNALLSSPQNAQQIHQTLEAQAIFTQAEKLLQKSQIQPDLNKNELKYEKLPFMNDFSLSNAEKTVNEREEALKTANLQKFKQFEEYQQSSKDQLNNTDISTLGTATALPAAPAVQSVHISYNNAKTSDNQSKQQLSHPITTSTSLTIGNMQNVSFSLIKDGLVTSGSQTDYQEENNPIPSISPFQQAMSIEKDFIPDSTKLQAENPHYLTPFERDLIQRLRGEFRMKETK